MRKHLKLTKEDGGLLVVPIDGNAVYEGCGRYSKASGRSFTTVHLGGASVVVTESAGMIVNMIEKAERE